MTATQPQASASFSAHLNEELDALWRQVRENSLIAAGSADLALLRAENDRRFAAIQSQINAISGANAQHTLGSHLDVTGSDWADGSLLVASGGIFSEFPIGSDGDVLSLVSGFPDWVAPGGLGGSIDHGTLLGLPDDDHAQYLLLAGRSGGQTVYGGTVAAEDLQLSSTSNATKGEIFVGDFASFDEQLNIATLTGPATMTGPVLVAYSDQGLAGAADLFLPVAHFMQSSTHLTGVRIGYLKRAGSTTAAQGGFIQGFTDTVGDSDRLALGNETDPIALLIQSGVVFLKGATAVNTTAPTYGNVVLSNLAFAAATTTFLGEATRPLVYTSLSSASSGFCSFTQAAGDLVIAARRNSSGGLACGIGFATADADPQTLRGGVNGQGFWTFCNDGQADRTTIRRTAGAQAYIYTRNATTNAVVEAMRLYQQTTGTPAAGLGVSLTASTTTTGPTHDRQIGRLSWELVTATDASRKARGILTAFDTAEREAIRWEGLGSAAGLGFFGAAAIAQPGTYTITNCPAVGTAINVTTNTYTGIDNLQIGTPYAQVADLNLVTAKVENLAGVVRQLIKHLGDTAGLGLVNETSY